MAEAGHQFEPFGATYVYVLEESHTYPEKARVYMDIFCCSPDFDPDNAVRVVRMLFKTADVDFHVVKSLSVAGRSNVIVLIDTTGIKIFSTGK